MRERIKESVCVGVRVGGRSAGIKAVQLLSSHLPHETPQNRRSKLAPRTPPTTTYKPPAYAYAKHTH